MIPLFYDPQEAPVVGYCQCCGGEIYASDYADGCAESGLCWFCMEEVEK